MQGPEGVCQTGTAGDKTVNLSFGRSLGGKEGFEGEFDGLGIDSCVSKRVPSKSKRARDIISRRE
jgi:hypothetical protein